MTAGVQRHSMASALPLAVVVPVLATAGALLFGLVLVALTADSVTEALAAFWEGATGSTYAVGETVNRASVLILVGAGFILANRANLTNVGGEGQIAVGGIAACAVALYGGVAGLPVGLAVLLPLVAGALAGGVWGGLAGVMKVGKGTNEVISTLLLSFIGLLLVYWSVQSENLLRQPMTSSATLPESLEIPPATTLPLLLEDPTSPLHLGIVVAVAAILGVAVVLSKSIFGVQLRAVGLNEMASRRAGIAYGKVVFAALAISGALGGLAGAIMIQGSQHYLKAGFSSGYGFDGLVVGLLSRGSWAGVVAAAALFGVMRSGGIAMEIGAGVPAATTQIIQGLIVIAVAGSAYLVERQRG